MPSTLPEALLETIVYFDLFDYPLTIEELQRYLWQYACPDLGAIQTAVEQSPDLEYQAGLVYLRGRASIVATRQAHYVESEQKWRKRLWYLRLLTYLPGVEALFVVNTMAYHNARPNSDIDILIIAKPGTIWRTRFVTTACTKLFGLRPKPGNTRSKVCLSYYMTDEHTNMHDLLTSPTDRHQAYWLSQWYPLYDPTNWYQRIWQSNTWLHDLLPNAELVLPHPQRIITPTRWHHYKDNLFWLLPESLMRWLQLKILPKKLQQLSTGEKPVVVLSNSLLKFHTQDPRPELSARFEITLQKLVTTKQSIITI